MIPSNKIKISELPQASGSEISQLDVLHLVKYPQKEGRKVQLVDLQSYFNSFSGSIGYVLSPSGSNTPYTSSYSYSSSYTNTASYAAYVSTASYALNVQNINSSSFVVTASGANSNSTASFALTAKQALTSSYFSGSINAVSSLLGDGMNTTFIVQHNFGSKNLLYSMFDTISNKSVIPDVTIIDSNFITVSFKYIPLSGQYNFTVALGSQMLPSMGVAVSSSYFSSFNGSGSITGSAGTIVQFLLTNINGVNYKIPLYGI